MNNNALRYYKINGQIKLFTSFNRYSTQYFDVHTYVLNHQLTASFEIIKVTKCAKERLLFYEERQGYTKNHVFFLWSLYSKYLRKRSIIERKKCIWAKVSKSGRPPPVDWGLLRLVRGVSMSTGGKNKKLVAHEMQIDINTRVIK